VAAVLALVMLLSWTGAGPAVAQTFKPVMALIVNDSTSPVPVKPVPSNLTHVGRPATDLLQLVSFPQAPVGSTCFYQTAPVADFVNCYVPPAGHAVVITDVLWTAANAAAPIGARARLRLVHAGHVAFEATTIVAADQSVAGEHQLRTGFLYQPELRPGQEGSYQVRLYGYVVPVE